jgi:calmodulin
MVLKSEAELQKIVNEIDLDGNGTIDFNEFVIMMQQYVTVADSEEELRLAYRYIIYEMN